jgi:hypothetical protein
MICHPEVIQPFSNSDHCVKLSLKRLSKTAVLRPCSQATVPSLKRYD